MLSSVINLVAEEGWFDFNKPFEKTIYLTQGTLCSLLLTRSGRPDTYVKFTGLRSLQGVAKGCREAADRYPSLVPRYLGYARRGSLEVLATEAVEFRSIGAGTLLNARDAMRVQEGLSLYFNSARMRGADDDRQLEWLSEFETYFRDHRYGREASYCTRQVREVREQLAAYPQHGDFVANNFGIRSDGRIVIFDWEDFAAVDLPGLDLFTLLLSLEEDRRQLRGDSIRRLDVKALCASVGLSMTLFRELSLSYALVFRYLKRNYSQEVRARIDQIVEFVKADH